MFQKFTPSQAAVLLFIIFVSPYLSLYTAGISACSISPGFPDKAYQ